MSCFRRKLPDGTLDKFYTVRFYPAGKTKDVKTTATNRADAEKYLAALKLAWKREAWSELAAVGVHTTHAVPIATIGQLLATYETHALDIKPSTRTQNIQALRAILATTLGPDPSPNSTLNTQNSTLLFDSQPLTLLDAALVHRWKTKIDATARLEEQRIRDIGQSGSDLRGQQIKRSANSRLRQARSIFNKHLREHYPRAGLILPPSIDGFLKAPGFKGSNKTRYTIPSDAILAKTFASLTRLECIAKGLIRPLPADPDRPKAFRICAAIWLSIAFALRKQEIAAVQHPWLITREGELWVSGDKLTKNGDALDIACAFPFARRHLLSLGIGRGQGPVIPGTQTMRQESAYRDVSHWMRALGWDTEKTIHEFRAWSICQVANSQGIEAAQKFARHADLTTTQRNYGRYLTTQSARNIPLTSPNHQNSNSTKHEKEIHPPPSPQVA
jgi:integrase